MTGRRGKYAARGLVLCGVVWLMLAASPQGRERGASASPAPMLQGRQVPDPTAIRRLPGESLPPPGEVEGRAFYFTRAIYSGSGWGRGGGSWRIDYPEADRNFLYGLSRLTNVDAYERENPVALTDPELNRYPFLYALEVGRMALSEAEAEALRHYLLAGGFLVIDDFWGTREWRNFRGEMERILPGRRIQEIPPDHPVFHIFYEIDGLEQVPNVRSGMYGLPTYEQDGFTPYCRGIFDDQGRLMVLINWNTDLGDAWEWADNPYYPLEYSSFAFEMGVNFIIYAMTH